MVNKFAFNGVISELYEEICNESKPIKKQRKGHPCSIATAIKIGNANRGRVFSDEHKRKIGEGVKRHFKQLNK